MDTTGQEKRGAIPRDLRPWRRGGIAVALIVALSTLSACYPAVHRVERLPPPPQALAAPPPTQVYFYPREGQTAERQSRDHYECYNWAIDQTGFDPGRSAIPREERLRVVPMPPPGHDTATLAIAGAVLGALIGGPRHGAGGAIVGAAGGAIVGAASDANRVEAARRQEDLYAAQDRARASKLESQAADFRRAMSACLGGRGYAVR